MNEMDIFNLQLPAKRMIRYLQIYFQVYFEKYVSLFIMSKISDSNIFYFYSQYAKYLDFCIHNPFYGRGHQTLSGIKRKFLS